MKISTRNRTARYRLFAGANALMFVAIFFALPLYAAASLCVMPCCHEGSSAAALNARTYDCATDCSVKADEATAVASIRIIAPAKQIVAQVTPGVSSAAIAESRSIVSDVDRQQSGTPPALHVLNSVFRI